MSFKLGLSEGNQGNWEEGNLTGTLPAGGNYSFHYQIHLLSAEHDDLHCTVGSGYLSLIFTPIPGDANDDGSVDGTDYTIWADNVGRKNVGFSHGDFNLDGIVDGADYTIWANGISPAEKSEE